MIYCTGFSYKVKYWTIFKCVWPFSIGLQYLCFCFFLSAGVLCVFLRGFELILSFCRFLIKPDGILVFLFPLVCVDRGLSDVLNKSINKQKNVFKLPSITFLSLIVWYLHLNKDFMIIFDTFTWIWLFTKLFPIPMSIIFTVFLFNIFSLFLWIINFWDNAEKMLALNTGINGHYSVGTFVQVYY